MSAGNVKRPTLEKLERDAEAVRESARFVIVIENDGSMNLIDNGYRLKEGLPVAYMIAVIGWTEYEDVPLQTIKFEVTYHRHRPYMQIRHSAIPDTRGRSAWFIKPRHRVARLSSKDVCRVYPIICDCVTRIASECAALRSDRWKYDDWSITDVGNVFRGTRFHVNFEDEWMLRQVMLEHLRYMTERKVLTKHVRHIAYWIGHYGKLYSEKQLRRFSGARKVVGMVQDCYPNAFYQAILSYALERRPGKWYQINARLLLWHVAKLFGVWENEEKVERLYGLLVDDAVDETFPYMEKIRCHVLKNQPKNHGVNCVTVEMIVEGKYRERDDVPF